MTTDGRTTKRRKARSFGQIAEWVALLAMVLRGYRILGRNYLAPGGEIDLIALRGSTICFVEVKARPQLENAQTAINPQKQARVARAVGFWLSQNRWARDYNKRADAIFIAPWRWPLHIVGAFDLDLR